MSDVYTPIDKASAYMVVTLFLLGGALHVVVGLMDRHHQAVLA